jgi:hypothetical protein
MRGLRSAVTKRKDNAASLVTKGDSFTTKSSSSTLTDDTSMTYFQASDLPFGQSIFPHIWNTDPNTVTFKASLIGLTLAGLFYMWFSSLIVPYFVNIDISWDVQRGITEDSISAFPKLVSVTLGLPVVSVNTIILVSYGIYALFLVADVVKGTTSSNSNNGKFTTYPWPAAWKTDNVICYNEMFSEPTRWGRLMRRPGNTLSNVNYLVASLCVICSCLGSHTTIFWISDIQFGIMLFILAVTSNIWHACNAPWSQYPDLWSMDSCILYLMIRSVCMLLLCVMIRFTTATRESAQTLAATACVLVYTLVIAAVGKTYWDLFQSGWLHGGCPLSGRVRLTGKGNLFGNGHQDCHISTLCAYAVLPVLYTSFPTLWQISLLTNVGSVAAATLTFRTLIIGWTYRLSERFVLDGCPFVNFFTTPAKKEATVFHTIGAAIVSPTAVLHFFTGITLLAGYMHTRSVEGSL